MKLIIKSTDAAAVPGGRAFLLCDETGAPLPMQTRCVVDCGIKEATVTVEFAIDGRDIRIAE